jgi:hypothetical protein
MDLWADQAIEPPPSNYPRLEAGTLIPLRDALTAPRGQAAYNSRRNLAAA